MPVSHLPGEALVVRHVVVVSAEDLLALVWAHCTWPPPHKGHPQTCYAGHQGRGTQCFNATTMLLQWILRVVRTDEHPVRAWWVGGRPDATRLVSLTAAHHTYMHCCDCISPCHVPRTHTIHALLHSCRCRPWLGAWFEICDMWRWRHQGPCLHAVSGEYQHSAYCIIVYILFFFIFGVYIRVRSSTETNCISKGWIWHRII